MYFSQLAWKLFQFQLPFGFPSSKYLLLPQYELSYNCWKTIQMHWMSSAVSSRFVKLMDHAWQVKCHVCNAGYILIFKFIYLIFKSFLLSVQYVQCVLRVILWMGHVNWMHNSWFPCIIWHKIANKYNINAFLKGLIQGLNCLEAFLHCHETVVSVLVKSIHMKTALEQLE